MSTQIICASFWTDFENVMGVLPQEITFEVQKKRINEKITRRKISFQSYENRVFFPFFSSLDPLYS
jgi:hypothetical protein